MFLILSSDWSRAGYLAAPTWSQLGFCCLLLPVSVFPPRPLLSLLHPRLHPKASLIKKQQSLIIKAVGHSDKIRPPFIVADSSVGKKGEHYSERNASRNEEAFLGVTQMNSSWSQWVEMAVRRVTANMTMEKTPTRN